MPNSFTGLSNRRPDLERLTLRVVSTAFNVSLDSSIAGKYLICSGGTGTLTLPAASLLGLGHFFVIRNNNATALTLAGLTGTTSIAANASLVVVNTASGYNVI